MPIPEPETRWTAVRTFNDREGFLDAFFAMLQTEVFADRNVLHFYGVGGVGKTAIQNQIIKTLKKDDAIVFARIDLENPDLRTVTKAFEHLRVKLGGYKIPFHTFDAAFTVLWAKKNPNTPLPEMESTVLHHSDLLTDILDSLGNIPIVGPVPKIGFFLDKISRAAQKWWKTRGVQALKDIADMEPPEIEALLPRFFGDDINAYLQSRPRKIVILIDTYEAPWEQPHLRAAQGHPYALDLALTHIEKIRDMGKTPTPDDIGYNPRELFERFMKNLEGNEQETLKVLSVPRRWDKDIFETLIKRFNTGYPLTRFSEFHRYSFIETTETPGEYGMHDVMRSSLHGWTDPGLRKDAHETMWA